ncbi:MAG: NAD(P)-dependent glycerol-3-phosphate dehydrogenase [Armatimonadetes bacterium]|nr:NAD(P)-dependent glycerol-3-phosphate dehydrogenase [Armatimonadota bacterium]
MSEARERPVAVIGAGSWGTGLAWLLGRRGLTTRLWCRRAELAEAIAREHFNPSYLPEAQLPDTVTATADLAEAVRDAQAVLFTVPSVGLRAVAEQLAAHLPAGAPVISAVKGLDHQTGERMTVVLRAAIGEDNPVAALSGPNLAHEIAAGQPAGAVIAHPDPEVRQPLQALLSSPTFRVYTNPDVAGVELCGALKNPLAIAAGVSDGLGYGDNTKAALMTRGMHEITRLGVALGADRRTFAGLCGFGDLLATCHSPHSRNRTLGERLGRGEGLDHIIHASSEVAEGVPTTRTATRLARGLEVEMPILYELHAVLFEGKPPSEAVETLLGRITVEEFH